MIPVRNVLSTPAITHTQQATQPAPATCQPLTLYPEGRITKRELLEADALQGKLLAAQHVGADRLHLLLQHSGAHAQRGAGSREGYLHGTSTQRHIHTATTAGALEDTGGYWRIKLQRTPAQLPCSRSRVFSAGSKHRLKSDCPCSCPGCFAGGMNGLPKPAPHLDFLAHRLVHKGPHFHQHGVDPLQGSAAQVKECLRQPPAD